VDRGAAFAQMLAKHAKAAAAGTRLTQLDDAAAAIAKPQTQQQLQPDQQSQLGSRAPTMVFLGAPGAGKGTYSTRVAKHFGLTPIAAGDLVREVMASGSKRGQEMKSIVNSGNLLPDSIILGLLHDRLAQGQARGERGVLLDGFPRTRAQAEALVRTADVRMAVNLHVAEEILISKCLGRRVCGECGKNFNLADIYIPATEDRPQVSMPPLSPPAGCQHKMEMRADDNLDTIKRRLEVYHAEASPVEEFFREQGTLVDFNIYGGVSETLPRLLEAVKPFQPAPGQQQPGSESDESDSASAGVTYGTPEPQRAHVQ